MIIDRQQLAAFFHVLRTGSFERAAAALHVTPSAVSQRIRALEEQMGSVLIVRDTPCRPAPAGEKLYRHALQVELLEADLALGLGGPLEARQSIALAVNADSLATWFIGAIGRFSAGTGLLTEIVADDQDFTAEWLRSGRVLGAVTASAKAVQGCRVERLGRMRYIAVCSPAFARRHFPRGVNAEKAGSAPMLTCPPKDRLQHDFIRQVTGKRKFDPPCHALPSPHAFVDAAIAGLGWGMVPLTMARAGLDSGALVRLMAPHKLDVELYWQCCRLKSETLARLTAAVREAAAENLLPAQ